MMLESVEIENEIKKHVEKIKKDLHYNEPEKKAAICALLYVNNIIEQKEREEIEKMYKDYMNKKSYKWKGGEE